MKKISAWFHEVQAVTLRAPLLWAQRLCHIKYVRHVAEGLKLVTALFICEERSWLFSQQYMRRLWLSLVAMVLSALWRPAVHRTTRYRRLPCIPAVSETTRCQHIPCIPAVQTTQYRHAPFIPGIHETTQYRQLHRIPAVHHQTTRYRYAPCIPAVNQTTR
jgi:hypothetical protein